MAKYQNGVWVFEEVEPKFGFMKGEAKWAHILKPSQYDKYSIDLYGDEVIEHIPVFEEMAQKAAEEIKQAGKKVALVADVYKENDEGVKYIQFKKAATGKEGPIPHPPIYDVYGNLVEDWDKLIGNGSIVKVKYVAKPYYMAATKTVGISYKLLALQVIKLVEYTEGGGGFGDESGGGFGEESEDVPF